MLLIFGVYGSELLDPGACIMHPPEFLDENLEPPLSNL